MWITANVHAGEKVAIFGLGAVGLAVKSHDSTINHVTAYIFYSLNYHDKD